MHFNFAYFIFLKRSQISDSKSTFVTIDEVDEDKERDVEVDLREERSPAGFTSRRRQTGVQLSSAGNKLRWER